MDFVTRLSVSTNLKDETYNSILVIVDMLMKIVYNKPVKLTINTLSLAEVIMETIVRYYGLQDFIINDWGLVFTLKFWSWLYYFFGIERKLLTAFHLQIDGQTKRPNNSMKVYLSVFVNFK